MCQCLSRDLDGLHIKFTNHTKLVTAVNAGVVIKILERYRSSLITKISLSYLGNSLNVKGKVSVLTKNVKCDYSLNQIFTRKIFYKNNNTGMKNICA